ncbi:MAG: uroporphyrinogen-III synthase [Anaerolineae bacterium]
MKRVLITRPQARADEMAEGLRAAGYEPILFPVIEIRAAEPNPDLDEALEHLGRYAWVVFTSANAVDIVFRNGQIDTAKECMAHGVRVAAIGPKTASALQARGVRPEFVPEEYVAEAILPGLGDVRGKRVLMPRAEIARKALPEAIAAAGGVPHEVSVYQTLQAQPSPGALAALRAGVHVITLTSPSTVENFMDIARKNGLDPLNLLGDPLIACIGPITEQAAKKAGVTHLVVADEYTTEGVIRAIQMSVNS